jgi:HYR domain
MNYQAGKIINLGIWGHIVEDNKAFLHYFDNVIIPLALGPLVNSTQYVHKVDNATYISIPATSPSGAVVSYLLPSDMSNNTDSQFIIVCRPPPGFTFPIGETLVKCTGTDKADNKNEIATFTIGVQDTTSH